MSNKITKIDIEESEVAGKAETYKKIMWIIAILDPLTLQWNDYLMTYISRNDALASIDNYEKDSYRIYEIELPMIKR